ncbi:MAG: AsmA-like C-terminal region-containing protein, partial [Pseudomonadota bacterium]
GRSLTGRFVGRINGGTQIRGRLNADGGQTAIHMTSDNAGGALRDAGLLRQASGGSLTLTLRGSPRGGWRGSATVNDTRITDAPAVAQVLSAISVVGILEQLDGRGLMMDEILADFQIKDDRFTLYSASSVGPSIGLSLDGFIDLKTRRMDLQGVVSPFYLVNAIGAIFTRRGEGLLGFNFTLNGPPNDISVGVNPLSILTPGLFREIFRRPPPEIVE